MYRRQPSDRHPTTTSGCAGRRIQSEVKTLIVVLALALVLPATGGAQSATPEPILGGDLGAPCTEGRLQIQDLGMADQSLRAGIVAAQEQAEGWQADARLVELRLGCPLLMSGLLWHGRFYSDTAQAYFDTDTGGIAPAELEPAAIPTLGTDQLSFQLLHRSLLRAGYTENLEIMPGSGVAVRTSTEESPFGPPTAPRGRDYFHVAVLERNEVKDVWVDAVDGTVYRFGM